ncbi:nucleotidyltransferase family protein [Dickeya poaceiphila]|nr:nucleotidyltransferase family protein [Dickeya poaceiphila]
MTTTRTDIDRVLTCFLFDPQRTEELARTLTTEQWQLSLDCAVSHKILPHVAAFYHLYHDEPLPEKYQSILHTHEVERRSWFDALRITTPFSQTADAMLMKGFGHEILYPEKMDRFAKDLDIVVADFSTFCRIATELLHGDFHLPFMAQFVWRKEQQSWQGLARFIHRNGNEDGGIELHIGQFAVDEHHVITWPMLRQHAVKKCIESLPLCVPDSRMMLVIFFMELATRPECMLRDLYDGYCLCMTLTDKNDIDALATTLNDEGLGAQVTKLLSAFFQFNQSPPNELVHLAEKIRSLSPEGKLGWRNRLRQALDRACQTGNLALRLLSLLDRPWAIRLAMRFAFPVYGIHLNTYPHPLHLIKHRHYLLLTTPAGTFLLGGVGLFSDEETEYLQSVINAPFFQLTPDLEP